MVLRKCRICAELLDIEGERFETLEETDLNIGLNLKRFKHNMVCQKCFKYVVIPYREFARQKREIGKQRNIEMTDDIFKSTIELEAIEKERLKQALIPKQEAGNYIELKNQNPNSPKSPKLTTPKRIIENPNQSMNNDITSSTTTTTKKKQVPLSNNNQQPQQQQQSPVGKAKNANNKNIAQTNVKKNLKQEKNSKPVGISKKQHQNQHHHQQQQHHQQQEKNASHPKLKPLDPSLCEHNELKDESKFKFVSHPKQSNDLSFVSMSKNDRTMMICHVLTCISLIFFLAMLVIGLAFVADHELRDHLAFAIIGGLFVGFALLFFLIAYPFYVYFSNDSREKIGMKISNLQEAEKFIKKQTLSPTAPLTSSAKRVEMDTIIHNPVGHLQFAKYFETTDETTDLENIRKLYAAGFPVLVDLRAQLYFDEQSVTQLEINIRKALKKHSDSQYLAFEDKPPIAHKFILLPKEGAKCTLFPPKWLAALFCFLPIHYFMVERRWKNVKTVTLEKSYVVSIVRPQLLKDQFQKPWKFTYDGASQRVSFDEE